MEEGMKEKLLYSFLTKSQTSFSPHVLTAGLDKQLLAEDGLAEFHSKMGES